MILLSNTVIGGGGDKFNKVPQNQIIIGDSGFPIKGVALALNLFVFNQDSSETLLHNLMQKISRSRLFSEYMWWDVLKLNCKLSRRTVDRRTMGRLCALRLIRLCFLWWVPVLDNLVSHSSGSRPWFCLDFFYRPKPGPGLDQRSRFDNKATRRFSMLRVRRVENERDYPQTDYTFHLVLADIFSSLKGVHAFSKGAINHV